MVVYFTGWGEGANRKRAAPGISVSLLDLLRGSSETQNVLINFILRKPLMSETALVNILMGSKSDWEVMKNASDTLKQFGITHECRVLSAHRTPHETSEYVTGAEVRGVQVIIAAAGGAAHLAGVCAAHTVLPVLGVPMESKLLGLDSLLSTAQMPGGIPVGTLAVGKAGAINAALLAVAIMGTQNPELRKKLHQFRKDQAEKILKEKLD
jgi:5-(carboxyamino)imidazole ribonucleotide mutase